MTEREIYLLVFISLIALLVIAGILVAWYFIYKKVYYPKRFKDVHYKTVRKVVFDNDFRLINKFTFPIEEHKNAVVDHIIFGKDIFYSFYEIKQS